MNRVGMKPHPCPQVIPYQVVSSNLLQKSSAHWNFSAECLEEGFALAKMGEGSCCSHPSMRVAHSGVVIRCSLPGRTASQRSTRGGEEKSEGSHEDLGARLGSSVPT